MSRFNPYVVAGTIMALTGAYLITDDFQVVPKIILIIGMTLTIYGYWNYDKINKALKIYRKMEGRNKRNGAEYVENTKDASVDTLAEEFKGFPMFKLYSGAVRGGADAETTTRLIGSMILGRSITDEKFRDRFYKASSDLIFRTIDEIARKEI